MLLSKVPDFFKARRDRLMKNHPNAVFVLPAHPEYIRNSDVYHSYRQDSNFYYLSGFEEAHSCLILAPSNSQAGDYQTILFVHPKDPEKEMWEGERYGVEGAIQIFGADRAYPIQELSEKLAEYLYGADRVFCRMGFSSQMDQFLLRALESAKRSHGRSGRGLLPIEDPIAPLGEMRLFKEPAEIEWMRKACQITANAHRKVMEETRPGMNEGDIEALIDYYFRKSGCKRLGYGSIVAGGKNAACLHYRANNEVLKNGDLLLIDAGGEYEYYSADITRTFPVGREFTSAQAKAYDLVLMAQKEAIQMVQPGATLINIHRRVCEILVQGLLSLGLLKGNSDEIIKNGQYRRFYPHQTSHWLGMDVHDAGIYYENKEPRLLKPGMVLTIEPGFYVQPSDFDTPEAYRNLGIRIEDDILVTSEGCEILTKAAPKEIAEIEAIRK